MVKQQFEVAKQIIDAGLVPIIEPEVDIKSPTKREAEGLLKQAILSEIAGLQSDARIMLKLTIPSQDDFYKDLMKNPHIVRIVALSGGYSQGEANEKLSQAHGLVAGFPGLSWKTFPPDNRTPSSTRRLEIRSSPFIRHPSPDSIGGISYTGSFIISGRAQIALKL